MKQDLGKATSPDEQLFTAFSTLLLNINNLQTFYLTTKGLLESGNVAVEQSYVKNAQAELAKPEWQKFEFTKSMKEYGWLTDMVVQAAAKRSVRISKHVIDSSALVFAHTILDGTLSDCCSILFDACPAGCFCFVAQRKVELGELQRDGLDAILRRKTLEFINQLKRESMAKRWEFLHKVCVPKLNGEPPITRWLSVEQLESFDQLRHKVVHVEGFAGRVADVEEQMLFAAIAGISALVLVGKANGLNAGGLLDKDRSDSESMFLKLFSGMCKDFPELDEQLGPLKQMLESIRQLLTASKP